MESVEERTLLTAVIVADYRDSFQEVTPAPGWEYLWNDAGPIGDADNYTPLLFTPLLWDDYPASPGGYDVDGVSGGAGPFPGSWANLTEYGGHPGQGDHQPNNSDNTLDRYVIAGFTVSETSDYFITDGFLKTVRSDGPSNGVELRVYVNDTFVPGSQMFVPQLSESPIHVPIGTLNAGDTIYVAIGPNGSDYWDGFHMDYSIQMDKTERAVAGVIVADYRDSFQEVTPAPGWQYLWNDVGPIGDADNYTPLLYTPQLWNDYPASPGGYDVDGLPGGPGPSPGSWASLFEYGGDPGQGDHQPNNPDNTLDRYVIAAYTVGETSDYFITDGFLRTVRSDGPSNGVELRVYVNDTFVPGSQLFVPQLSESPISVPLGTVSAGDTIYVAIGPNGSDYWDSFHMDFTIKIGLTAQLDALYDYVIALDLPNNFRKGLISKINEARDILEDEKVNNDHVAANKLNDLIKQVDGNKKIDDDDELKLITATRIILDLLEDAELQLHRSIERETVESKTWRSRLES